MSKVFEALQRQQQNEQKNDAARDPLAAETGTPDAPHQNGVNGTPGANKLGTDDNGGHFELPSVIGAPIGPRSNEGAVFPSYTPSGDQSGNRPEQSDTAVTLPIVAPEAKAPAVRPPRPAPLPAPATTNGKIAHEPARPASYARRAVDPPRVAPPVIRRTPVEQPQPSPTPPEDNAPQVKEAQPEKPIQRQREIPVEPIVESRIHPRLILLTDPQAPECEQYRTLRTQLFHAAEKKQLQTVTITSTLAGEGKTSTVINLALAIAQSKEKRVLVIDGDLRRPNVAAYLGVRAKTGLGEILSGEVEPLDTIFTVEGHELYVLPVSREVANPTELLSSERWAAMMAELRRYFDFILVDSPPVMPFADVRLLANHTDAVMLVVRAGMATYDTVEKAIEALPAGKMLGVVLNGAENIEEAGYYDYYYDSQRGQRRSVWNKLLHPLRKTSLGRKWKL
ncbi:MAG: polysaccharide biosynthesis tyrosine autokinase [Acidobacteriota bacterium]